MNSDFVSLLLPLHLAFYAFAYGLSAIPTRFFLQKFPEQAVKKNGYWIGFFLDMLKGSIPVGIASSFNPPPAVLSVTLLFALFGQMFSIWQKWQGRPGLPVLLGGLGFIYAPAAAIGVIVFFLLHKVLRGSLWASFLTSFLVAWLLIWGLSHELTLWIVIASLVVLTKDYFKEIFTARRKD